MKIFNNQSSSVEFITLKVKLEFLEKENSELKLQVQRLQEALIAKTSPVAYSNLIAKEAEEKDEKPSPINELQESASLLKQYLDTLADRPAFANPDEFVNYVRGKEHLTSNLEEVVTAPPLAPVNLHNEES